MGTFVDRLSPTTYLGSDNAAESLANDRFDQAQTFAEEAFNNAKTYLDILSQIFSTLDLPTVDTDYTDQQLSLAEKPEYFTEAPDITESISDITEAQRPEIDSIVIQQIDLPNLNSLPDFEGSFNYSEVPYQSDLADAIRNRILNNFDGTGLGATVENAIWVRARARNELKNEKAYTEAETYFSARGFILPPGTLVGRLADIQKEISRSEEQINYEIMIEQARLAQNNTQFNITSGIQFEGQNKDFVNNVANRALTAAEKAITVILDIYKTKLQQQTIKLELAKTETEIQKVYVEAQATAMKAETDLYIADIESFKAKITKELGIIETLAKIYALKLTGNETNAKIEIAYLDAQIKEFLGNIDQEKAKTELNLKEAEITLQAYLSAVGLHQTTAEAGANISAQIAASALSGVSASAHLSDSVGYSVGKSYSHSQNIDNNLNESHTYDHSE